MAGAPTGRAQHVEVDWEGPGAQPCQPTAKGSRGDTAEENDVRKQFSFYVLVLIVNHMVAGEEWKQFHAHFVKVL